MGQEGDLRWWPRVKTAWPYASSVATTLFCLGAAAGLYVAWRMGVNHFMAYVVAIADPAAAALLIMSLAVATPDIFAAGRLRFLHILAFPTVYVLGIVIFRFFISASPIGLMMAQASVPRFDRMWSNLYFLIILWGGQVLLLLLLFITARLREKDKLA